MKTKQTKQPDSHYVSHESPQFEPTIVDTQHASIETGHPDPIEDTQDGLGIVDDGNSQQAADGSDPRQVGGEDERSIKPNQKVTLGRHVKSDDGFAKARSRHTHVASQRKEHDKVFSRSSKK